MTGDRDRDRGLAAWESRTGVGSRRSESRAAGRRARRAGSPDPAVSGIVRRPTVGERARRPGREERAVLVGAITGVALGVFRLVTGGEVDMALLVESAVSLAAPLLAGLMIRRGVWSAGTVARLAADGGEGGADGPVSDVEAAGAVVAAIDGLDDEMAREAIAEAALRHGLRVSSVPDRTGDQLTEDD